MTAFSAIVSRQGFESKHLHTASCDNEQKDTSGSGSEKSGQLRVGVVANSVAN